MKFLPFFHERAIDNEHMTDNLFIQRTSPEYSDDGLFYTTNLFYAINYIRKDISKNFFFSKSKKKDLDFAETQFVTASIRGCLKRFPLNIIGVEIFKRGSIGKAHHLKQTKRA